MKRRTCAGCGDEITKRFCGDWEHAHGSGRVTGRKLDCSDLHWANPDYVVPACWESPGPPPRVAA